MLLVHQAGSVKIGEVVRYTLTYTPSNDRILPTPKHLHLKIKNTSAIPLRAAWVHGPYTLHVATYPSTFNPHVKDDDPKSGVPEFEPMLKAGGNWQAKLTVPEDIRETGADLGKRRHSTQSTQSGNDSEAGRVTWIIEITSQILFSNSASVHFEVLVGRDERSLELGFAAVAAHGHGQPGQIKDQLTEKEKRRVRRNGNVQTTGVYSKAVKLVAEDTEALWDKPALPTWEEKERADRMSSDRKSRDSDKQGKGNKRSNKKRVHLIIVTHGLHSNLGADMLFLKESIDATVAQARLDAQERKKNYKKTKQNPNSAEPQTTAGDSNRNDETATAPVSGGQEELNNANEDSDDEEETIVRGFSGNAVRTENGIQYLGKRLAKYILRFTYPDQPFLPVKKSLSRTLTDSLKSDASKAKRDGPPSHHGSSVHHPKVAEEEELPYTFTKISFIGHSLGGLIQTYAVAYIQKHSPTFFQQIEPINFICMASPMLGLSNENPMYVKFALDFGLVGRTGQDLGLTWRPPTIAKTGWNAVLSGLSSQQKDQKAQQEDPTAKPLLRILPTGPAHQVLRLFRNRTVYSNVVNDGIVPLRTSCLLFLDWRGLGKVDKARRDNGLIGTVAEWGWAELTGANTNVNAMIRRASTAAAQEEEDDDQHVKDREGDTVPLPAEDETGIDSKIVSNRLSFEDGAESRPTESGASTPPAPPAKKPAHHEKGMLDSLMDFFRPSTPEGRKSPQNTSKKTNRALRRGQTLSREEEEDERRQSLERTRSRSGTTSNPTMRPHLPHLSSGQKGAKRPFASRGDSVPDPETGELQAPPKTSIFESAGDILHPPLPSTEWITDPTTRSRTIFHDRVYHPEDIPPPPAKRPGSRLTRSFSSDASSKMSQGSGQSAVSQDSHDSSGMKVEEKIARAYHRDLSWRKVLVRLEPDAHNNMIVRRMFANAYGWPVVKHLCDTHFADTYAAKTRDEEEPARERAPPMDKPVADTGEEVAEQTAKNPPARSQSETREARDELADLSVPRDGLATKHSSERLAHQRHPTFDRQGSAVWDDSMFEDSNSDSDVDERNIVNRFLNPMAVKKPEQAHQRQETPQREDANAITRQESYTDGHRGLAPTSPTSPRSPMSTKGAKSKASVKPTFDSASVENPVVASRLTEEPQPMNDASVAANELRKSISAQSSPTKTTGRQGSADDKPTHAQSQH